MATCKHCGCNIEWCKSRFDGWVPFDLNGRCHLDTCPKQKRFKGRVMVDEIKDYTRIGVHPNQKQITDMEGDNQGTNKKI